MYNRMWKGVFLMNDLKFQLLNQIYNASNSHTDSFKNLFDSHIGSIMDTHTALKELCDDGLIQKELGQNSYKITSAGRRNLESLKEIHKQKTENKRIQATNKKLKIAQLLVSPIIFVLGLIVEYSASIIDFLFSFFK